MGAVDVVAASVAAERGGDHSGLLSIDAEYRDGGGGPHVTGYRRDLHLLEYRPLPGIDELHPVNVSAGNVHGSETGEQCRYRIHLRRPVEHRTLFIAGYDRGMEAEPDPGIVRKVLQVGLEPGHLILGETLSV